MKNQKNIKKQTNEFMLEPEQPLQQPQPLHKPFDQKQVIIKLPDAMSYKALIYKLEHLQMPYKWQFSTLTVSIPRTGFLRFFR